MSSPASELVLPATDGRLLCKCQQLRRFVASLHPAALLCSPFSMRLHGELTGVRMLECGRRLWARLGGLLDNYPTPHRHHLRGDII